MKTDLLKYDASSMVELLRRRLMESGVYTDQIYPGSDTSILIDLFSYMFEVLAYMLNSNASDSLFADSSVYENMNRIVKLLSYNPKAYTTSNAEFTIGLADSEFFENAESMTCTIPKFASILLNSSDERGNQVRYSFIEDYTFSIMNGRIVISENPVLYNGEFTKYDFSKTATGEYFEVFTMNGVGPNSDTTANVCQVKGGFRVFIKESDNGSFKEVNIVDNLIMDAGYNDLACETRVNENKEIEIKFGDDIHGKTLKEGTFVYAIYLNSNGAAGMVDVGEVNAESVEIHVKNFFNTVEMIEMLYSSNDAFKKLYGALFVNEQNAIVTSCDKLKFVNINASSDVKDYETVDEIRENAPANFRIGNRLVTASDFESYIKNSFSDYVKDVYVCNNNEYCLTFYKWLDEYGAFNSNIRMSYYKYASACDFNNIYIWLMPHNNSTLTNVDKNRIINKCNEIKTLTTTLVPCEGVKTYFVPFLFTTEQENLGYSVPHDILDENHKFNVKILIKKKKTKLSDTIIKKNITEVFTEYFEENSKFGFKIDLVELARIIYDLGYVESIKTVSTDNSERKDRILCEIC